MSNPDWVCQVCLGSCTCSRCCTRGPPKWFGHKNPNWRNPETISIEISSYKAKAMKALEQRNSDVTLPQRVEQYPCQQMCTCCHICRKSVTSSDTPFMPCSTCTYIICKACFGRRIAQTWEEAQAAEKWSCTVCHGDCSCGRCTKRGPPSWYGRVNSAGHELEQKQRAEEGEGHNVPPELPPVLLYIKQDGGHSFGHKGKGNEEAQDKIFDQVLKAEEIRLLAPFDPVLDSYTIDPLPIYLFSDSIDAVFG
jgi:hypothetical protein